MKALGIITGVLMSILGVFAFSVPVRTFLGIGWVLGILFLVHGIENVIAALGKKKKDIWQCVLGALGVVAGLVLLFSGAQRILTDVMIAYLVGIFIAVYGGYQIYLGAKSFKEEKGSNVLKIICGIISIIAGLMCAGHPLFTMISVGYLIAFSLIMQGIDTVIASIGMGKEQ